MEEKAPQKRKKKENRSVLYVVMIVVSVVGVAAVILMYKLKGYYYDKVCLSQDCVQASVFFLDIIDPKSDPCENFYNFSCGGYEGRSTLQSAQIHVNKILKTYITSPIKERDSYSVKLQKKYYRSCTDVKGIEGDRNSRLKEVFRDLGGWPALENNDWSEKGFNWGWIVEKCIEKGLYYDWFLYVENESLYDQSNENLHIKPPDNVNKIGPELKESYVLLMVNVVSALGNPEKLSSLSDDIKEVVIFENELYQLVEKSKEEDQEEIYSIEKLRKDFPFMPWPSLLKNVVWADNSKIIFTVRNYLINFEKLLNRTPKRVQANYIFWKVTESMQTFLSIIIRDEFETFAELRGNPIEIERSKFCYEITSTVFAYVSEGEYARKRSHAIKPVQEIIKNIKEVLVDHITNSTWMNSTHKTYAKNKLRKMNFVIGALKEMFDTEQFDKLLGLNEIDILELNNTLDVVMAVDKSRDAYNLNLRRSKINIERINFYHGVGSLQAIKYLPDENLMFLPAAAFISPIYSEKQPSFTNYGALGTIIGHELVHGFGIMDSIQYEHGIKKINWSNSTLTNFLRAAECLLNNCNEIGDEKSTNTSCQKTFEENFADYTGVDLAYEAYLKLNKSNESRLPGLPYNPRQLFWISYASTMCYDGNLDGNATEHFTHMTPDRRIMGSFRNSDYFGQDFNCPINSNMNPSKNCKVL